MNKYQTYILIGNILSLDNSLPLRRDHVISLLQKDGIKWEKFVQLADYHLVLQALYPKIVDFRLENYFPEELLVHLKYIFDLNTSRNILVLQQSAKLTSILNSNGISPLFMKGVGNLLNGLYKYPGERILHDIDILVPDDRFEEAAAIMIKDGYSSNYEYVPGRREHLKHYPILFKKGEPFYVELHRMLVHKKHSKNLIPETVFRAAVHPEPEPNALVMSDEHSIVHNFLHSQVDHRSRIFARAFIRDLYDLLLLSRRSDPEKVLAEFGHFRRNSAGYLDIIYETFGITPINRIKPIIFIHTYLFRYKLNLKSRVFGTISFFLIRAFIGYVVIPIKATWNAELRKRLITKIRNPEWYKKQVNYYMKIVGIDRGKSK